MLTGLIPVLRNRHFLGSSGNSRSRSRLRLRPNRVGSRQLRLHTLKLVILSPEKVNYLIEFMIINCSELMLHTRTRTSLFLDCPKNQSAAPGVPGSPTLLVETWICCNSYFLFTRVIFLFSECDPRPEREMLGGKCV